MKRQNQSPAAKAASVPTTNGAHATTEVKETTPPAGKFATWLAQMPEKEFDEDGYVTASVEITLPLSDWFTLRDASRVREESLGETISVALVAGEDLCDWVSRGYRTQSEIEDGGN